MVATTCRMSTERTVGWVATVGVQVAIVPAVVQIYQSAETGHLLIVKNLWGLTRSQIFAPLPYKIHYEDESQT